MLKGSEGGLWWVGVEEEEKGFGYIFNMHIGEAAAEEASENEIQQLLMFPFQQSRWPFLYLT